jgi:hypothetical protein
VTDNEVLSPREARLVAAISADPGATQEELAAQLQVTARWVRKLLARQPVRKALDEVARDGLAAAASVLGRGAQRAAHALVAMATGAAKATTAKVAACKAMMDGGGRLIDLVDLERRIQQLEHGEDLQ